MNLFRFFARSVSRSAVLALSLVLWGCGGIASDQFSGDVDLLLSRGDAYVARLSVRPASSLTDAEIIALGYAERARLGLGSPFRLIEFALEDPDLPAEVREPLAYGILSRTLQGRSYFVDPRVLESAGLVGSDGRSTPAYQQLELIERSIETAPSPAGGEKVVRLGYLLAGSERTVDPEYTATVAHVASLVADRRRAREDASLLLSTAARRREDPLALMISWRRDNRFTVERPALVGLSVRDEEAEATDGPALALALRALAQRQSAALSLRNGSTPPQLRDAASLLDAEAAERLRELAAVRAYPAQAPVAVAVAINREGFLEGSGFRRSRLAAREAFVEEAVNEERLAAGAAVLRHEGADRGPRFPIMLLQAATFLRGWNQEEPWFPGDPAPAPRDLEARFGLAGIQFDREVPDAWRPYYLRMLGRSIADLQRALPMLSVRGLTIRFGEVPSDLRALALHEPRTRTLYLPPGSGAGTLAHELAHDLDWQLARNRYGTRGGYATDLAVRDHRGDRIAAAMMELSASLVQPATEMPASSHSTRPAEVFARGTDWLVASLLARDGRLGGYLTSFQDPTLTGYGTTRGPDISGGAVPALLAILDAIAPMNNADRNWALETYGPHRSLTATELAAVVTSAGNGLPADQRLQRIGQVGRQSFAVVNDCRPASADGLRRLAVAQRELAEASLGAAARGAAIDAARALAVEHAGVEVLPLVDSWVASRFYGAPQPVDPVLTDLIPAFEDLLIQASMMERGGMEPAAPTAFDIDPTPSMCGGNPFAADSPVGRFRTPGGTSGF